DPLAHRITSGGKRAYALCRLTQTGCVVELVILVLTQERRQQCAFDARQRTNRLEIPVAPAVALWRETRSPFDTLERDKYVTEFAGETIASHDQPPVDDEP